MFRLMCFFLQLVYAATQFVAPILLPFLLEFVREGAFPIGSRPTPDWHGYVYSVAIVVASALGAIFFYHASLRGWALGIQIKSVLTLLTYRKALYVAPNKKKVGGNVTCVICPKRSHFCGQAHSASFAEIWYLEMHSSFRIRCPFSTRALWRL